MLQFCHVTYRFVVSVALELEERFKTFNNPLYEALQCLSPVEATTEDYHKKNPIIFDLLLNKCKVILKKMRPAITETRLRYLWQEKIIHIKVPEAKREISDFWMYIYHSEDDLKDLAEFALYALAIPHANVAPESFFSHQNEVKSLKKPV